MVFYQVFFQNNAAFVCKVIFVLITVIDENFIADRTGFFVEKKRPSILAVNKAALPKTDLTWSCAFE